MMFSDRLLEPGLKTILWGRGPLRRCLILAQGVPSPQIDDRVRRLHLLDARADLLRHDFRDPGRDERIVAGRPWRRASDCYTTPLSSSIWRATTSRFIQAMHSSNRSGLRKALRRSGPACMLKSSITLRRTCFQDFVSGFEKNGGGAWAAVTRSGCHAAHAADLTLCSC